jgi:hypothetical protein
VCADLTLGQELLAHGWQNGSVVPLDLCTVIISSVVGHKTDLRPISDGEWLIVISQTCDVVCGRLDQEPLVEILRCAPIDKPRAGFRDLASTRTLDFRPNRERFPDLTLTAHATRDRLHVPREILRNARPDQKRIVSRNAIRRISEWYSLRYTRPAWPNAFVDRIAKRKSDLVAALESIRDDVAEVRIALLPNDADLDDDQTYSVAVFFVVEKDLWESDATVRRSAQRAFVNFVSVLAQCPGIDVNQEVSGVFSGAEFSWEDARMTDRWNFAHLTFAGEA